MSAVWEFLWFIVAVSVLVTVHEFGHYWVARRLGFKVLRFSVGFGKPLLSRVAGPDRTEYVLASIPLGGYVKMLDEREGPVPAADLHRSFTRKTTVAAHPGAGGGTGFQHPVCHCRALGDVLVDGGGRGEADRR